MRVSAIPSPIQSSSGLPETFTKGITATTGPASATGGDPASASPSGWASACPPATSTPSTSTAPMVWPEKDFVESNVSLPNMRSARPGPGLAGPQVRLPHFRPAALPPRRVIASHRRMSTSSTRRRHETATRRRACRTGSRRHIQNALPSIIPVASTNSRSRGQSQEAAGNRNPRPDGPGARQHGPHQRSDSRLQTSGDGLPSPERLARLPLHHGAASGPAAGGRPPDALRDHRTRVRPRPPRGNRP